MNEYPNWFTWEPSTRIIGERADEVPSKPPKPDFDGFDGATPGQIPAFLEAEPAAYEDACDRWLVEQCVFHDRVWFGLYALHDDYFRWCDQRAGEVPAGRRTFRELILNAGFTITENELVYGLMLTEDLRYLNGVLPLPARMSGGAVGDPPCSEVK